MLPFQMAAVIHHLNCATMCPYSARLLMGKGGWLEPAELVAHVLVIETDAGLALVDTGLGTADVADPARTSRVFRRVVRPKFRLEETAIEQIKALGHDPSEVRHIALTHLDLDHAGALGDFPQADVHIFEAEVEAALNPRRSERARYIQAQWAHGPNWVRYRTEGDQWFGFDAVRAIRARTRRS
jgi:glyoxylase-like metal-dependent hydrolase (beta-lactamase superfamily II)